MSKSNYYKKVGRASWNDEEHTSRAELDNFYDLDTMNLSSTGKKKANKKAKKKCDHKHKYVDVIGLYNTDLLGRKNKTVVLLKRCSICGRISEWKHPTIRDANSPFSRYMTLDEILKVYGDLEIIEYD